MEPSVKSYEQIYSDMISTYIGKSGLNDLNTGSVLTSFFESMAQAVYRASADNLSILRDFDVDRATGEKLKRIARGERVVISGDKVATGSVTITDTSFEKIATKIYAGSNPPNIGSSVIRVSDASNFTPTGSIYIGRGTNNIEGPLSYSSITQVGSFFEINLDNQTTKFHNISESVILAQGGVRTISAGEVVVAPASGATEDINFTLTRKAIILDGENTISGVSVAAQEPGDSGNIPRGAIRRFAVTNGALSVTNESGFTTGKNADTDAELRTKIKRARLSRGLGTKLAIRSATLDAQAPDENATVTSNEIFSDGQETTLFVDNGDGYEEVSEGVGLEFIVDSAFGGELGFSLSTGGSQTSIVKATLTSNNTSPFSINPNDRLAILVGGELSEHVFNEGDFRSNGNATAFEVVASINSNSNIQYSAATSENGTKVSIFAKRESSEFLEVTDVSSGVDSNIALGLPSGEVQTLRLYKNNKLLSKDGRSAQITSEEQNNWSNTIIDGDTLVVSVDNTQFITYTFNNSDFLQEGNFTTVNKNNTLESWINVINSKVTGLTASINGNKIVLTSNLGLSARASLKIDQSSTLVSKGMFTLSSGLESTGKEADYLLSRNTAQFKLLSPLEKGDKLTAGNEFTKAQLSSSEILGGTLTLSDEAQLWISIDNQDVEFVNNGVVAESTITVSKPSANIIRYTSNVLTAFENVEVGDYVVVWSKEVNANNRLEARVNAKTNEYIEIKVTPNEFSLAQAEGPVIWKEGIFFARTDLALQKITIPSGTYNINTISSLLQEKIEGATSTVSNNEIINITTQTESSIGEVFIVDFNDAGKSLGFSSNSRSQSEDSLFAFYETNTSDKDFPLFINESIANDNFADPSDSYIVSFDSSNIIDIDPNVNVCFNHPLNSVEDNVSDNECVQIQNISSNTVSIKQDEFIKRLRQGDRFHLVNNYQLGAEDSLVVIVDNDASEKTFSVNLYREALVNNTSSIDTNNFRAYDSDSGSSIEFSQFFGDNYDFSNYKVMMKARNVLHPTNPLVDQDALLIRSVQWGSAGEKYNIGYVYPSSENQEITHNVFVSSSVDIRIGLKSGNAASNNIDGTTEWDVTITNAGAFDEVTYTWNGTGTNPLIGNEISGGGYVTITEAGEFSQENTGTFRVDSATSSSFTVIREVGSAVAENNRATLTIDTISLFENNDTTCEEINTYIEENLSEFITSEIIDDNGLTGSGIISKSTEEDSDFTNKGIFLLDGINWLESSDLDATAPTAQFRFKRPLSLASFSTSTVNAYAFNAGELIRFIPTNAKQVSDFMNVLAVTGLTTVASVNTSTRNSKLQIKTNTLGSQGAIDIAGGKANSSNADVVQAAAKISQEDLAKVTINKNSSKGFYGGQWVKLEAARLQKKDVGFGFATAFNFVPNSPSAGLTTIELLNRSASDIYFGESNSYFDARNRSFSVEKHGSLTAIIWNGVGNNPLLESFVEIGNTDPTIVVVKNNNTGFVEYTSSASTTIFSELKRNDTITFSGLSENNNGTFPVVGVSNDGLTVVVNNPNGEDQVSTTLPVSSVSAQSSVKEGDLIRILAPFDVLNTGSFRVIRRYENSIYIDNPNSIEETVAIGEDLVNIAFDGTTEFEIIVSGSTTTLSWTGNGTQPDFSQVSFGDDLYIGSDFGANNSGKFKVTKVNGSSIEYRNALSSGSTSTILDILEINKPSIYFDDYDNTVSLDTFVVSGDVFDGDNIGSFTITDVLSRNSIVVSSILAAKTSAQLQDNFNQVYVEEAIPYIGYKKITTLSTDPANTTRTCLVLDSSSQFLKINKDAGEVSVNSIGKLEFPTNIIVGLDSYRYHTGLIAESNRIVYGEPRDSATYPGVSAAGAEIFIRPPLVRKVELGVGVRVNTGIPFTQIVEQARNNIAALVNSNDIGVSIAISDIVSVVNSIPGVKAVSITSPLYDINNDVIVIRPSEKAFILDLVNDITISKVD